jgi:hypothetical protein
VAAGAARFTATRQQAGLALTVGLIGVSVAHGFFSDFRAQRAAKKKR